MLWGRPAAVVRRGDDLLLRVHLLPYLRGDLGERRSGPLLTMQRVAYDDSGRAVEFGSHYYRASLYSFEFVLSNHR